MRSVIFKLATVFSLALFWVSAQAAEVVEVSTKKSEYNEFLFKQPFVNALLSPARAQEGKSVVLNNNKNLLFKFKEGWDEPIQLFVVMRDGTRKRFKLIPNPNIDGATWPKEAAGNVRAYDEPVVMSENKTKEYYLDILKELYESERNKTKDGLVPPPGGFSEEVSEEVFQMGPILGTEIKRFSNTVNRISVYRVTSEYPMNITPADFYYDGVILVELNYDVVTPEGIDVVILSKEPGLN